MYSDLLGHLSNQRSSDTPEVPKTPLFSRMYPALREIPSVQPQCCTRGVNCESSVWVPSCWLIFCKPSASYLSPCFSTQQPSAIKNRWFTGIKGFFQVFCQKCFTVTPICQLVSTLFQVHQFWFAASTLLVRSFLQLHKYNIRAANIEVRFHDVQYRSLR